MKKLTFYCLLAILCSNVNGYGQTTPLRVGDTIPPLRFTNLLNTPAAALQLPAPQGRAVVLAFFGSWCGACIKELPRLQALQDSMQGRLQIILVSREPKAKLEAFLQKRTSARALPIVYEDSQLNSLFPNRLVPHDVWIAPGGRVAAITPAESLTGARLQALLTGDALSLPVKTDLLAGNGNQPLEQLAASELLLWKSTLGKAIPGEGSSSGFNTTAQHLQRLYIINQSALSLYQEAWLLPANRVQLTAAAEGRFFNTGPGTAGAASDYCYELLGPEGLPVTAFRQRMRRDLDAGLGYCSSIDSILLPVYEILPGSPQRLPALAPMQQPGPGFYYDPEQQTTTVVQQTLPAIARWLNARNARHYRGLHLRAAGISSSLLFSFTLPDSQLTDATQLGRCLAGCGMQLVKRFEKIAVLVIQPAPDTGL